MSACTWGHPGADRYTGNVPAAIVAYHLPLDTQSELIRRFEGRQFDDAVSIDRDTIRGRDEYEPGIRSMHFGSAGKFCDPSRNGWDDRHVETALVVCTSDGAECVAWPAVCGNVFRITRRSVGHGPTGAGMVLVGAGPLGFVDRSVPIGAGADPAPTTAAGATMAQAYQFVAHGGGESFVGGIPPLVAAAVPEPSSWVLLLIGLGVFRWRRGQSL